MVNDALEKYQKERAKPKMVSAELEDLGYREWELRNVMLNERRKTQQLEKTGPRLMAALSGNYATKLNNDKARALTNAENAKRMIGEIEKRRNELERAIENAKHSMRKAGRSEDITLRITREKRNWESKRALERFHAEQKQAKENKEKIERMRENLHKRRR